MSGPDLTGWIELGTTDGVEYEPITFTAYYDQPKGGNLLAVRSAEGVEVTEVGEEFAVRMALGEFDVR